MLFCDSSDIHHLNRDWDPAQCCRAPAPQSSALPVGHYGLLLPPGPQAKEDLSCLCDTSSEGTTEQRSQTWGQKIWIIIWLGLCAFLLPVDAPPSLPLTMAPNILWPPQYSTDEQILTFQTWQQEWDTPWWKWVTLSLDCEVQPLLIHSSFVQCCYSKEGASSMKCIAFSYIT